MPVLVETNLKVKAVLSVITMNIHNITMFPIR